MSESSEMAPSGATFTDAEGREWHLRITVADLPWLRELGMKPNPIGEAVAWIEAAAEHEPEKLVSVAYRLSGTEVPPSDFAAGFDGPALWRLVAALAHAVIDFFPSPTAAEGMRSALNAKLNPTPNPSTPNASAGNWRESSG